MDATGGTGGDATGDDATWDATGDDVTDVASGAVSGGASGDDVTDVASGGATDDAVAGGDAGATWGAFDEDDPGADK